jgi:hypothetical protein
MVAGRLSRWRTKRVSRRPYHNIIKKLQVGNLFVFRSILLAQTTRLPGLCRCAGAIHLPRADHPPAGATEDLDDELGRLV